MSNSSVCRARRKLLKDSADLQLYDSEFQTDGALTLKAFADNASVIRGIDSNSLSADRVYGHLGDKPTAQQPTGRHILVNWATALEGCLRM